MTTRGGEREQVAVDKPATGQALATVPRCTADDVELAVERARAAQAGWRQTDWVQRRSILLRFHVEDLLEGVAPRLAGLELDQVEQLVAALEDQIDRRLPALGVEPAVRTAKADSA